MCTKHKCDCEQRCKQYVVVISIQAIMLAATKRRQLIAAALRYLGYFNVNFESLVEDEQKMTQCSCSIARLKMLLLMERTKNQFNT